MLSEATLQEEVRKAVALRRESAECVEDRRGGFTLLLLLMLSECWRGRCQCCRRDKGEESRQLMRRILEQTAGQSLPGPSKIVFRYATANCRPLQSLSAI